MKKGFMLFTMACAVAAAFAAAQDNEKKPRPPASLSPPEEFNPVTPPKPTTPKTNSTTTPPPKPTTPKTNSTTTPPPKPTTPKTNSTTTPPPKPTTPKTNSTTTPPPKPTTPKTNSTTHSPATNSTTAAPTTHHATNQTTAAPTTPPQPTPKANLTVGDYVWKQGSNVCVMASMALQIRVEFPKDKSEGTFIVQQNISTVNGTCNEFTRIFNIIFKEGFINLTFQKNTSAKLVYISSIAVELTYPFNHQDPKAKYSTSNNSVELFHAAIGHSYSCKSQSLYLGQGVYLDMTHGRVQAFNITNGFGLPDLCSADQPDYRVAIAVGIVLLILIVIVVVAYLIGRKRRTDGYQSL
ncbi:hypothetical protein AAFF_G00324920 [Aldrovandia affinis]|uniref:Macrosialin n=1 Tax=Aldrovandia affinis TaxID=143900 RepID=A0AAD7T8Z5_9TELE|nr:hypothetical protein AAFF_G00324920 [Aldrovandia affinis]